MTTQQKNQVRVFFDQFTATKDRPVAFQVTVSLLVTSAILLALGSAYFLATGY